MRPLLLFVLVALFVQIVPETQAQTKLPPGEYVILTGGVSLYMWEKHKAQPHDNWWLNFIRASRIRMEQLRSQFGPTYPITWLVYEPAYRRRGQFQEKDDLFGIIRSVEEAYQVKLIFFSSQSQLLDILNSRPNKIAGLDYFGHSNKACLMFDYSNEIGSASKVWLHENELKRLRRGIFASGAYVKSWGCHTGESMSQKFRSATGIKMIGAKGKTQYMTHELPYISTPGGFWVGQ